MQGKTWLCTVTGALGGVFASAFGGWSAALMVLCVCMTMDYVTGLIVAGVFHKSPKTTGGGLESKAGWKGLLRKVATLVIVVLAHFMDVLLGTRYVRDAVIIAFCTNELLSIVENCALMGVPIPAELKKAIEVLKTDKEEKK